MPLHIQTPLIHSDPMSVIAGRQVFLKLEMLQPSGSFKLRGVGAVCEAHAARGARRFVSSSGGNAGIAVAYAGRKLSVPVTVVVPETVTQRSIALLQGEQAQVIVYGKTWYDANAHAMSLIGDGDAFIHPFDDPLLWAGHASLVEEIAGTGLKPDAIVLSVGGGGLFAGVVKGLRNRGWDNVPVIAAETAGADALSKSLTAGKHLSLDHITSVATSLGASKVCEQAFSDATSHPTRSVVVEDSEAIEACERFLGDHRILVEPACGASLAVPYLRSEELRQYENILVIVCGGVTTTVDQLRNLKRG